LVKKPLSAPEFVPPLAKIDPIYKEEEEAFKVLSIKAYSQDFHVCRQKFPFLLFSDNRLGTRRHRWARSGSRRQWETKTETRKERKAVKVKRAGKKERRKNKRKGKHYYFVYM
jgi:hypothetical protein